MPNRYEREIEEILRNLETTEPRPGRGQKFGERLRRKPEYRARPRRRGFTSLKLGTSEWLTLVAVVAALVAGGVAYTFGPTSITGIFSVVGIACLLLLVLSPFISRSRNPRYTSRTTPIGKVTPLRRNPLSILVTRWNLFILKMRYRRQNRQNHPK
jgi:Flp pilus assembly protein TadB